MRKNDAIEIRLIALDRAISCCGGVSGITILGTAEMFEEYLLTGDVPE